jgi:hypothetical protein
VQNCSWACVFFTTAHGEHMKRQDTDFRVWLQRIYMDHKDEAESYGLPICDADTYFRMYKYWLKREFKHQQGASK